MTQTDIRLCTTHELEYVLSNFTYYEHGYLAKVKRELDKRHRQQLIKRQNERIKSKHNRFD